ncbi:MAG: oligosaccharide flippase family protein, partial [Methanomassiliicoccales archaeon]|nr:oligosaccharide flippase family protein [Methanomassiliicoccales archaeon]
FGLDSAVIHRQTDTDKAIETASTLRFLLSLLLAVLLFVLAPLIADMVGNRKLVTPLQVSSIAIVVAAFGFETSVRLSKDLLFKSVSMTRLANTAVWSVAALALAYLGLGFWSLLFACIAGFAATAVTLWIILPWKIPHKIDSVIARELVRYAVFPLGVGILGFLVWNVDKLAVGAILGSSALLGSYYIAFSYGTIIPNLFTGVTLTVMFPTFSKTQTDLAGLRETYLKALKYLSHISIPAGVGLAVVSQTFVLGVLGSDWSDAVAPLEVFSIVGILGSLTSPAASVFLATGNPDKMFRQTWVTALIYFVFLVPAIFYGELVGVAALFLVAAIVSLVWVLFMVAEILRFTLADELRMLIVPAAASAIMAVLTFGVGILMGSTMLSLGVQILVAILAYSVCVILMTKGEIVREVKGLLASARSK